MRRAQRNRRAIMALFIVFLFTGGALAIGTGSSAPATNSGDTVTLHGVPHIINAADYCHGGNAEAFASSTGLTCDQAATCAPGNGQGLNMTSKMLLRMQDPRWYAMGASLIVCQSGLDADGHRYYALDLEFAQHANGGGTPNGEWSQVARLRVAGDDTGSFYQWTPINGYAEPASGLRTFDLGVGSVQYTASVLAEQTYLHPIHTWSTEASWSAGPRGYADNVLVPTSDMRVGGMVKVAHGEDMTFTLSLKSRAIHGDTERVFVHASEFVIGADGRMAWMGPA